MVDFHERKKIKKMLYSKVTLGALSLAIILVLVGIADIYKKKFDAKNNLANSMVELEKVQHRQEFLTEETDRLSTDIGIEKEIRDKFGVHKEGEGVIVIVDNEEEDTGAVNKDKDSFWGKIFGIFR